ncbi:MAG: hypothetical protein CMG74_09345 [Candidatus Marinimicrobia bacterium]|nr:hypothetical protein [Candidatus Neomarinimicrobiota bacterium]|tara:strand:- start:4117 stop:5541 length:1425 start_codon:yes stop_codon:yes gene_type:complete
MKKSALIFLVSLCFSDQQKNDFKGYANFAYISRLSDFSLIDIPYRMVSLDFENRSKNLSLNGNFVLEYQVRSDTYFLESIDPQDFRLDMRELYATYIGSNIEIQLGKQIHSWGSVDENSPLDNAGAKDYYYIFFSGKERKIGSLSAKIDYYFNNLKASIVFSPLHQTNRIPLGNDDFPITLPVYPKGRQIYPISELPLEGGIYTTISHGKGDVSFSYYSTYDRIFNLTGVNIYGHGSDLSFPYIDILYGYRKTNILGIGGVIILEWFVLRGDIGYFLTKDLNSNIKRESTNNPVWYDSLHFSYPLKEQSNYYQTTFQIEAELPFNMNLIAQYFQHDTISYSSENLPVDQEISLPNLNIDPEEITPAFFFNPGVGAPLATLTNKAAIIMIDRLFMNQELKFSIMSIMDLETNLGLNKVLGSLTEFKIEYNMYRNLLGLFSITKINGSNIHPEGNNYQFNKMESFSHIRFEIKYFF